MDIKQKAIDELNKLQLEGDYDRDSSVNVFEECLSRNFKNSDFFTPREGEEDDDHASFTGRDLVLKIANNHFSQVVLDNYSLKAGDQEKDWFTIYLKKKN